MDIASIKIDHLAGTGREVERYASPEELFARLTAGVHLPPTAAPHLLEPFDLFRQIFQQSLVNHLNFRARNRHEQIQPTLP